MTAKDPTATASFFSEDAFVMYPQPAPTIGRQANYQAWARYFARPEAEHPFTTDTVIVAASRDPANAKGFQRDSYPCAGEPLMMHAN